MGFPRQEYWDRLPFLPPGDLLDPVIEPVSPVSLALAGRFFTTETLGKPIILVRPVLKRLELHNNHDNNSNDNSLN